MTEVVAAIIGGVSAIIAGGAWRRTTKVKRDMATSNGMSAGAMIEANYNRSERMEGKIDATNALVVKHITDKESHVAN